MSLAETLAKAVAVKGAMKIIDPKVRAVIDTYHTDLKTQCEDPGETAAVLMMDSLSFAAASSHDHARGELRTVLKHLVDVIFDTVDEQFPNKPVVLH